MATAPESLLPKGYKVTPEELPASFLPKDYKVEEVELPPSLLPKGYNPNGPPVTPSPGREESTTKRIKLVFPTRLDRLVVLK